MEILNEKIYLLEEEYYNQSTENNQLIPHIVTCNYFDNNQVQKQSFIHYFNDNTQNKTYFLINSNDRIKILTKKSEINNELQILSNHCKLNNTSNIRRLEIDNIELLNDITNEYIQSLNTDLINDLEDEFITSNQSEDFDFEYEEDYEEDEFSLYDEPESQDYIDSDIELIAPTEIKTPDSDYFDFEAEAIATEKRRKNKVYLQKLVVDNEIIQVEVADDIFDNDIQKIFNKMTLKEIREYEDPNDVDFEEE
jgi:hypothetical protein